MTKTLYTITAIVLLSLGVDEYFQPVQHFYPPVKFVTGTICVFIALFWPDNKKE